MSTLSQGTGNWRKEELSSVLQILHMGVNMDCTNLHQKNPPTLLLPSHCCL